jgi:hypothetical protein
MKSILISPYDETVSEVVLPEPHNYRDINRQIDCDVFTIVQLNENNAMFVDDEGLLKIADDAKAAETNARFFLICDESGAPRHLIAGKGLVLANDSEGDSVSTTMTVDEVRSRVKFLKAENGTQAVALANEVLYSGGVCTTQEEMNAIAVHHESLMQRAMQLT